MSENKLVPSVIDLKEVDWFWEKDNNDLICSLKGIKKFKVK